MKEIVIKNISIGDELLIGQVINTNAAWLGEHLSSAGFQLDSTLTIGDSEKAILDAFNACRSVSSSIRNWCFAKRHTIMWFRCSNVVASK